MTKQKHIKDSRSDKLFYIVNGILLLIFTIVELVPLIYVVAASFSSATDVIAGNVFLWPVNPTFAGYEGVFQNENIVSGFINSFVYMIVYTIISLILTTFAAFSLAERRLPGRRLLAFLFTFTMLFGGGLIPTYLQIRDLQMIDTIWAVTVPGALSVYNMILMKSYFQHNIPNELFEAASIDGCGIFRYLFQFVIPLSGAIIAIIALYSAVGSWNGWFNAMLYLNDKAKFPLQLILRDILITTNIDYSMMDANDIAKAQEMMDLVKYSVIVVSTLPMMVMYPFVQKYFVKGVMTGAVKG